VPHSISLGDRGVAMMREYTATLPHPIGVNAIWRAGRFAGSTRIYKTPKARAWDQDAFLLLRAVGWKPLPEGEYWLALFCTLHTRRHDIDSCLKLTLDAVAAALEVDDANIGFLTASKVPVKAKADQRLELVAKIYSVDDQDDWADRSRAAIPMHESRLTSTSR